MAELEKTKAVSICERVSFLALCVTAFFFPISKAIIESFSGLAILGFLIKKFIQRQEVSLSEGKGAVIVYLLICFSSIFTGVNPHSSARTFFGKTLQETLLFFTIVEVLVTEKRLKGLLYALFASSLLLGVDGIFQAVTYKDFIRQRTYPYAGQIRINASFITANDFGSYLAAVIPFLLVFLFDWQQPKKRRIAFALAFILLFLCLVFTVSRGAWFAFITSLLFMGLWVRSVGALLLILLILVLLGQPLYGGSLKERIGNFFSFRDVSSTDRGIIWRTAWNIFLSRPWIGLGLATFMSNFRKFCPVDYHYGVPYTHNCYLQMMAEIGIIGLSAFLAVCGVYFFFGVRALRVRKNTFAWYMLLACLSSVLGYCVQMGVDTSLYSLDLGMLFWFILGVGFAAIRILKKESERCGV